MALIIPKDNVLKAIHESLQVFIPKPILRMAEFADKFRMLPAKSSSERGKWRTDRFPFLKDIMNSLDILSPYKQTVFMKASQIGGTESLINAIFYYMYQKPQPILSVQPTIGIAEKYSKQRIGPSISDCPAIDEIVVKRSNRDGGGSTILEKQFTGGMLMLAGANSAAGLRSMPIGILMLDEIDGYPTDVENEGDPVALALRRTTNFPKRRIFYNSTPTEEETSRVKPLYMEGTKRTYTMKCPHCGEDHIFMWSSMSWDKDENNKLVYPINAYQICQQCGSVIEEKYKTWMMAPENGARWVAEAPDAEVNSFRINAFYSPLGFYSWKDAVEDWYRAQGDRDGLKTFVNTILGETWEDESNEVEYDGLMGRRIEYNAVVPNDVHILTCAVDIQKDRFEIEVEGHGYAYGKWGIKYTRIYGDPVNSDHIWNDLDEYLARPFMHESGNPMYILCTVIDSGDGGVTDRVYDFCRDKAHRHIYPIKGGSGGMNAPILSKPTKNSKGGTLFVLGVDSLKANVFHALRIEDTSKKGYWHFPKEYDEEYFKMLTSEKRIYVFKNGVKRWTWKKIRERNEALDLACYNRAALEILNPDWDILLDYGPLFQNIHEIIEEKPIQSQEVNMYESNNQNMY